MKSACVERSARNRSLIIKILVVGSGMYVTGRNETGVGTVLASLAELSKNSDLNIEQVLVTARTPANENEVRFATDRINEALGSKLWVTYQALGEAGVENLAEILKNFEADAAIVSTPDHTHFAYTKALLDLNIHCLVVKPLTPSLAESVELTNIQKHSGCIGYVEFHKRYDQSNLRVKKAIGEGVVGDLLFATVDYSQKADIPLKIFRDWTEKTNVFQYLGVHYVDQIYFMTGFRPTRVSAIGTYGLLKENGLNAYDAVNATIMWENPSNKDHVVTARFSTSWVDSSKASALSDQKFKFVGTKGRLEIDQKYRGLQFISENKGIEDINPYFSEVLDDAGGNPTFSGYGFSSIAQFTADVHALSRGVVSMEELESTRPTFADSLVATSVVEAVNKSLLLDGAWENVVDPT